MLNSFGTPLYSQEFFKRRQLRHFIVYSGLGSKHALGRLWKWEGCVACTMGVGDGWIYAQSLFHNLS
jgi:hypothetical protein